MESLKHQSACRSFPCTNARYLTEHLKLNTCLLSDLYVSDEASEDVAM